MPSPPAPGSRPVGPLLVAAVWLALLAAGFGALVRYGSTAGPSDPGAAPAWPPGTALAPPRARPALLLFVHPSCPCTRATMEELARTVARAPAAFDLRLVLVPAGAEEDPSIRAAAGRIPGLRSETDPGGTEAARFGARTSGTVAVYAADGRRLFFGGITSARGHEGESEGTRALLALARGEAPRTAGTPVFGCGLAAGGDREP